MKTFKWTIPEPKHAEDTNPLKELTEWQCPKCKHKEYDTAEFHAAGSGLAKLIDIQSEKFSTITCKRCSYTEIYRCRKDQLSNIFDFFVGS